MSKLFDTLEQIRSNESSSLSPAPETAHIKKPESRKKILAMVVILCGIATGLLYYDDISFFTKADPSPQFQTKKQSALETLLPSIVQPRATNTPDKSTSTITYTKAASFDNQSLESWKKTLQKPALSKQQRSVTLNNIGSYYIFHRQHWKGLAYIDQALTIEPANLGFLINFGIALAELGMVDLSTEYFQRAWKEAPGNATLIENWKLLKETKFMPTEFNTMFTRQ